MKKEKRFNRRAARYQGGAQKTKDDDGDMNVKEQQNENADIVEENNQNCGDTPANQERVTNNDKESAANESEKLENTDDRDSLSGTVRK